MKEKLRFIIKSTYNKVLSIITYFFRVREIMIFESHPDYSDNSKALFDRMLKENINNKFKIYWIVDNKKKFNELNFYNVKFVQLNDNNFFLIKFFSRLYINILIRISSYYFFSHRDFTINKPRKGQKYINLTHGTPLKDIRGSKMASTKNNSYFITTSEFSKSLNLLAFSNEQLSQKIKILGFPRNDLLFENKNVLKNLNINKKEYNKVLIWMPTFRRNKTGERNDNGGSPNTNDLPIIKNTSNWKKLDYYLEKYKILLIVKQHPAQNPKYFPIKVTKHIKKITDLELYNSSVELYNLLGESDGLITDYSSVFLDYLLLNRPIAFTVDDIKEYNNNLGFLVDNVVNYMPGNIISNLDDLIEFIKNISVSKDEYEKDRLILRDKFNKYKDNKSSERIIRYLDIF